MFRFNAFGGASFEGPEGPVGGRAAQRHRLALLALLAAVRGKRMTRDRAIALLWPEAGPEQGRRLLSDSIYRINKAVGGEAIRTVGDELRLDSNTVTSDVIEFETAVATEDWEQAAQLHVAPFLDGFYLPGSGEFERWTEDQRQRLRREKAKALEQLASTLEGEDPVAASHWWRALAATDPYSSRVALRLMQCLVRAGDPAGAVRHAADHAALVREDLGLEPDPEVPRFAGELRERDPHQERAARVERPAAAAAEDAEPAASAGDARERLEKPDSGAPPAPRDPVPSGPAPPPGPPPPARRSRARPWLVLVPVGILAVLATWWMTRWPGPAGTEDAITSLIVLPFSDLSPDGTEERLADGITEELITQLSNTELRVVGRTSAFAFKGQPVDALAIGERLNVGAVLDGSVRRSGDRLRISAQLASTSDGFELWSETYERTLSDVFAIQDEIARSIVARLTGSSPTVDPGSERAPIDPEVYNLYLAGRFEWHRRTESSLLASADYLEQAVALVPEYARAHAGLGDAYAVLGFYDYLPPAEAFPRAAEAARRAIDLDPDLAEPYATLGYVALYWDWDGPAAERAFQQALARSPGYSTGHQWYANLLTAQGRFPEAVREMRRATELDPLSLIANAALGWVHYYAGDHAAALAQIDHARTLDPDFELAYLWGGWSLEAVGDTEASLAQLRRATELSGSALSRAALARGLALAGDEARARDMLTVLEREARDGYAPAFEIAKVHAGLGDGDAAMAWLRRALDERSHSMVFLAVDPQLETLRDRPDFQAMVEEVGIGGS